MAQVYEFPDETPRKRKKTAITNGPSSPDKELLFTKGSYVAVRNEDGECFYQLFGEHFFSDQINMNDPLEVFNWVKITM